MVKIEIPRAERTPSHIYIGQTLDMLPSLLPEGRRVFVVTDSNLQSAYTELLSHYETIVIGLGEENKTLQTVETVHRRLVESGADRECYIVGFGGGIVTDVTGFVASTYMRGVGFGFVATSLLAQVDASVGGKNGVNLGGYKNMVGVFNQPDFVVCDTDVLGTLPRREFCAGMAEVVKSAVIGDATLFEILEKTSVDALLSDKTLLTDVIARTVRVKARIVTEDERETGARRLLNLGHTVAHAIEKCSREYVHGEAVAVGMVRIARIAVRLGVTDKPTANRIEAVLERFGLPVSVEIPTEQLAAALHKDKKGVGDSIYVVLPERIGSCEVHRMPYTELTELL